jgi:hypothetical protein
VAGRVGDDELPFRGREVTVSHVDGDPLLALGLQAVHQQRQVDVARRAVANAVRLDGRELVLVDEFGVMEEPPDERALPVIHASTGEEAQEILALVLCEIGVDVGGDEIGLMAHQK